MPHVKGFSLDNLTQWMDIWLLRLNIGKCKAVSYGRRPEICINYNISGEIIEKNEIIKGLECRLGVPVHCLQSNGVIIHYDVTHFT